MHPRCFFLGEPAPRPNILCWRNPNMDLVLNPSGKRVGPVILTFIRLCLRNPQEQSEDSSYCFNADLTIYEFCNTKRIITVTTIVEGLTSKVIWQWKGLQTRCLNMSKPQKDDDTREWMGGLFWSKTQKVQRVHQFECSYASFMLSLRYYLCLFYTNYASTKKQCYVVSCLSVYFLPPQRRETIRSIRW